MDRDVFTYIADLSEEKDTPFNEVLNEVCRDGIAARKKDETPVTSDQNADSTVTSGYHKENAGGLKHD